MQNIVGNAGQSGEACRIIEVPDNRHYAVLAQERRALTVAREPINTVAFAQLGQRAQRHVAATDDQQSSHSRQILT